MARCRTAVLALSILAPVVTHAFAAATTNTPLHSSRLDNPALRTRLNYSPTLQQPAASTSTAAAAAAPRSETQQFGARRLIGYLWPEHGAGSFRAKLRVVGALVLLLAAKLFIVRVPFVFKRCIDSMTAPGGASALAPVGWMVAYGLSRAVYTLLQEARYLLFTPVGQNALRRFMCDAFDHVQMLDAGWLGSQSTGELSRVFARGVRGMNALLRLVVFNVVPTALEALLVIQLLGRRYVSSSILAPVHSVGCPSPSSPPWSPLGGVHVWARRYGAPFLLFSMLSVVSFVAWSLLIVEKRITVVQMLNDNDNQLFTQFFNALLNNEAVRSFTNERHEVRRYDELLGTVETLSVRDVQTISLLNAGQALIFAAFMTTVLALCARRVLSGALSVGDVVAIHGILLQLQQPLNSLAFTYQEIRTAVTDMRQLLLVLGRTPKVMSRPDAPPLRVSQGVLRFENVSFGYASEANGASSQLLRGVSFSIPARKKTAIVGSSGSGKSTVLKLIMRTYDPDSGSITIDGQDVRDVDMRSLRRQLGLVPQDTILFDESIL